MGPDGDMMTVGVETIEIINYQYYFSIWNHIIRSYTCSCGCIKQGLCVYKSMHCFRVNMSGQVNSI